MSKKQLTQAIAVVTIAFAFSACQEELDRAANDGNVPPTDIAPNYQEITIDASSNTQWNYVDLTTGKSVAKSDNWHIAVQRYSVIVNSDVDVALLAEQSDFYNGITPIESIFVNATASSEVEHLTQEFDLDSANFATPSTSLITEVTGDRFFDYQFTNHKLYANDDAVWVIRSSTGSAYAKLRPIKLYDDATASYDPTFELYVQGKDDSGFSSTPTHWQIPLTDSVGTECYDIDSNSAIDCANNEWDIHFDFNPAARLFELKLNGGISGSGSASALLSGPFEWADNDKLTAGIQDNDDSTFTITSFHYGRDSQASTLTESPWYAYGIQGGHGIWPNYRVYGLRNDTDAFAVQFVNYYNEQAQSGHVTLRFRTLN